MTRTLASEDGRKEQLFDAWIEHLRNVHVHIGESVFEEIYEGLATVSDLSKNRIGFHLEDGRKLRHVPITPIVSSRSAHLDCVYIILGLSNGKWWPLDVISIGSIVDGEQQAAHVTFNPLHRASFRHPSEPIH